MYFLGKYPIGHTIPLNNEFLLNIFRLLSLKLIDIKDSTQ